MYDALSRARTFEGLFICENIDESKKFHVDPKLLEEEDRLRQIETKLINFLNRWFQIKYKIIMTEFIVSFSR